MFDSGSGSVAIRWSSALLGIGLAFFSACAPAVAAPLAQTTASARLIQTREVSDGKRHFTLQELYNARGEYEVRVLLNEERWFAPTSHRTLLVGRAIDVPEALTKGLRGADALRPKRITTWFIPTSLQILNPIEFLQTGDDPWPTALSVIQSKLNTENRWYSWVLIESIAPQISLAISHTTDFFAAIKEEQMDLLDFEIRLGHLELTHPDDPLIPIGRQVLVEGWASIRDRVRNEKTKDVWLYAAGDVALTVTAGKVFALVGKWLGGATTTFSKSALGKTVASSYERLSDSLQTKAASVASRLKHVSSPMTAEALGRVAFVHLPIKQKVIQSIAALEQRSAVARTAIKGMGMFAGLIRSGVAELPYIGLAQMMQVVAETAARPEDLFDPNPIVMAKKMAGDADFIQNVAYMTNETFWMAGANHYLNSAKKKIAICGAIGLVDSVTMSLLIKGEANPRRIAFDSGWEAAIGNIQTLIDTTSIAYFHNLAVKTKNPKLRLLGYVVAFVDQGAGYFGYAAISRMVDPSAKSEAPSPVREPSSSQETPAAPPSLKLIPVLGPV